MKKKLLAGLAVGAMMFGMSTSSMASVIVLDFEGFPSSATDADMYNIPDLVNEGGNIFAAYYSNAVGDYYNNVGGPNYGISFTNNFKLFEAGSYSNNPTPGKVLYYEPGTTTAIMNVAPGFNTGFSLYYAASSGSTIKVYDGLNATGNELASLDLKVTPNSDPDFNPWDGWDSVGVGFNGTAKSVKFRDTGKSDPRNLVLFDNITLGSITPSPDPAGSTTPAPEPASMLLLGTGLAGLLGARKVKKKQPA